jgi:xylulokinase
MFLGLDFSTQSITAIIIDLQENKVVYKRKINFDKTLPHYNTQNGVISSEDPTVVHSYPLMWVESLELLFKTMKESDAPLEVIKAISGSGQQHGTVYLNNTFESALKGLHPKKSLKKHIENCFTRKKSPIWMDSSTTKQCKEIRKALGGMKETIKITGSNIFERFSASQIRKFYQEKPNQYKHTKIIHLVSSFMASILIGKNAPIDHGDGAGMNLMNISTKEWDPRALKAAAPNLREKLPNLAEPSAIIGNISDYFVKKYGFSKNCNIIAFSGDNPNSLIGTGLIKKRRAAISLGTSDTFFSYLESLSIDLSGEGHVFGAPTGDYMSLVCFKNGSLARERIKNHFGLDWEEFSKLLSETNPGNDGKIMLPYFFPEIVPLVLKPDVKRYGFDESDVKGNIRGIVESQFLSMRLHSQWIGKKPQVIFATGSASMNEKILQVAADVFNIPVHQFQTTDSAALGASLRAAKSYCDNINLPIEWEELTSQFLRIQRKKIIYPNEKYKRLYNDMLKLYELCEQNFLEKNEYDENAERKRLRFIAKYFS